MSGHDALCFLLVGTVLPAFVAGLLGVTWPLFLWLAFYLVSLMTAPKRSNP